MVSFLSWAQVLDKEAIQICENSYEQCALASNQTEVFRNCTQTFNICMDDSAYKQPAKKRECFLAEAAWDAAYWNIYTSITLFFATFLGMPVLLKTIALLINYAKEHCGCFGKCLVYATDSDGDGVIKPSELLQPALTVFASFSFFSFLPEWTNAIKAQAECDWSKTQIPGKDE